MYFVKVDHAYATFLIDGNDEGSISAGDSDVTPSRSSPPSEPQDQCPSTASVHAQPANSAPQLPSKIFDIGKLLELGVDLKKLSQEQIYHILMAEPSADPSTYPRTPAYPGSIYLRQFQPSWLKQYPWLHYSCHLDGVFCKSCAIFAPDKVGGHTPGQFVTKSFNSWVKMSERSKAHMQLEYHQTSVIRMSEFVSRYEHPTTAVNVVMDTAAKQLMERNKMVIESLLKITILCGKQGLPLRGHRDDGVDFGQGSVSSNQGNFIELVHFRAETDEVLANHLKNAPKNALYTSKTIQNSLIEVVRQRILRDIISEVNKAKYYTIIADEVTDLSNKEQLSLALRYVLDGRVKEVFVDFIFVERITGEVLAQAILQWLATWNIPHSDIRGQCYDGASNMAGARSGCMAIIQQKVPKAVYFHCASHRLNLAIVSACNISAFKNVESYIGEIARFFDYSAKRQRLLDTCMEKVVPEAKAKKLKDACRTRWVERVDSYVVFLDLLLAVHHTLSAMVNPSEFPELGTNWAWDGETITKANGFLYQIQSSSFLICFRILLEVMCCLRGLTKKLQLQAIDVFYAYKQVNSVVITLKGMRDNSDREFHKIFEEATKLGRTLHGEDYLLSLPRITGRQFHRSNPSVSSPEDYYRITLYNEFLSQVITEIEKRFVDNPMHGIGIFNLLPSECCKHNVTDDIPLDLAQAVEFYHSDLPQPSAFPMEYRTWVRNWKQSDPNQVPCKLIDVLESCDVNSSPNIHQLLTIALTLPITSCESERSFSQLKLIKTSLRSTMSSERLSGLALMKINRERCQQLHDSPEVLSELVGMFAQANPRRMKLPFVLCD